jgi:hypothetical protein
MTLIGGMNTDLIAALCWQWMNHKGTNNTKQYKGFALLIIFKHREAESAEACESGRFVRPDKVSGKSFRGFLHLRLFVFICGDLRCRALS